MGASESSGAWEQVKIGSFAKPVRRGVLIEPGRPYRTMGVKWWGLGAYERETKPGHAIKVSKMYAVRMGDLVINKIWVRHGSSGIVGPDLDGCVVTADFPTFELDHGKVLPSWLSYLFKTKWFWSECDARSRGTSGRQRIDPATYLEIEVPLPPLDEQHRIVARIEAMAGRAQEALILQQAAVQEAGALLASTMDRQYTKAANQWPVLPFPQVCEINPSRKGQPSLPDSLLVTFVPMVAVDAIQGTIAAPELRPYGEVKRGYTWFQEGDVLFAKITPCMQNGKSAIAERLVNATGFGSTEFHVLRSKGQVTPAWVHRFVRRKSLRDEATKHFTGSVGQQRVPQSFLGGLEIPVPPIEEQNRILTYLDGMQARLNALSREQKATLVELEALMPSVLDKAFRGEL